MEFIVESLLVNDNPSNASGICSITGVWLPSCLASRRDLPNRYPRVHPSTAGSGGRTGRTSSCLAFACLSWEGLGSDPFPLLPSDADRRLSRLLKSGLRTLGLTELTLEANSETETSGTSEAYPEMLATSRLFWSDADDGVSERQETGSSTWSGAHWTGGFLCETRWPKSRQRLAKRPNKSIDEWMPQDGRLKNLRLRRRLWTIAGGTN